MLVYNHRWFQYICIIMKKGLSLIIGSLLCCLTLAAQQDTTYYDSDWEVIAFKDTATYFRVPTGYNKRTEVYSFTDYFITGEKQATCGYFDPKGLKRKTGEFVWYFKNGQVSQKGKYVDDKEDGDWFSYFENGLLWSKYNYDSDRTDEEPYLKYLEYYDEKSGEHLIVNGEGRFLTYYDSGDTSSIGLVTKGLRTGTWKWYRENGTTQRIEEYKKGLLQSGISYDKEGNQYTYTESEVMPSFKGGQTAMLEFLATIKYPKEAREKNKEGTAYVQFYIDKEGNVVDVGIIRSSGSVILDNAAVRHVMKLPKWTPGYQQGQPVKVSFVVPIKFVLNDSK